MQNRYNILVFIGCLFFTLSCGVRTQVKPKQVDSVPSLTQSTEARIVLIGDTGVDNQAMHEMRQALLLEQKDLIIVLGDLVYPNGPRCPDGDSSGIPERILDAVLGKVFIGLGAPVFLTLGNHDVGNRMGRNPASEACFLDYAAKHDDIVMPGLNFNLDLGVALIAFTNTNAPEEIPGAEIKELFRKHSGWKILAGHHVLRTYHDKVRENYMRPILKKFGLKPDLYANGHAHFLQFGVYDGIPAATIGAGAKVRMRPECPQECGPGQLWGKSVQGYGLLELSSEKMTLIFKDRFGKELWRWSQTRITPASSGDLK